MVEGVHRPIRARLCLPRCKGRWRLYGTASLLSAHYAHMCGQPNARDVSNPQAPCCEASTRWCGWLLAVFCVYGSVGHAHSINQKAMTVGSENGVDSIGWLKMFAGQCRIIGEWLAENAPEDASMATTAGTIPFYSRLYRRHSGA